MTHQTVQDNPPTAAFIISLIGGVLGLVVGAVLLLMAVVLPDFFGLFSSVKVLCGGIGLWSLICGAIVVVAAVKLNSSPSEHRKWGSIILVFSIIGLGSLLGLVGGILALTYKPQTKTKIIGTKVIASIAIFSALYTVLRMMQTIPMIGIEGGKFSLSDMLAPLYGVILGPYVGGFSVILGTFLAIALGRPVSFMFLDFLPALVNAVALGFLVRRKWWPVVVLNAALLLAFLLNPLTSLFITVGSISFPFAWLHIVAFIVLISPLGRKAGQWVETLKPANLTAGLAILAFVGTMMQHLMGNILTEVVYGYITGTMSAEAFGTMWTAVFFVYPWERLILVILAVVVGVPLVRVLKKSFFRSEKQPS